MYVTNATYIVQYNECFKLNEYVTIMIILIELLLYIDC